MFDRKKILIILAVVLIAIVVFIIWMVMRNKNQQNNNVKPQTVAAEAVDNFTVLDPVLMGESNLMFYDINATNLAKLSLDSNQTEKLSEDLDQPLSLIWSPDRSQVIMKITYNKYKFEKFGSPFANSQIQDGATVLWHYNLATKKYTMLEPNIFNPASFDLLNPIWTTDSKHIIYRYFNQSDEISTLNVSDPDGSNWKKLGDVPNNFYSIIDYNEANNQVTYTKLDDIEGGFSSVHRFGLSDQKDEELITNVESVIDIDENRLIYTNEKNSFIFEINTKTQKQLPFKVYAEKAILANNSLAASEPESTSENIHWIDLNTQKITRSINPDLKGSNIQNLILSSKFLYFTNNEKLYKIGI